MMKGCILDLDGVIVDTAKYHYIAWKELANELGIDFTTTHNEELKGISRMQSIEFILSLGKLELSNEQKLHHAERKNNKYLRLISVLTPDDMLPGVQLLFDELVQHNIRIALGSASKNAQSILDKLAITRYFDAIIDGTVVKEAKPNPEVFIKATEALALKPHEVVVFEDAKAGVEAAINGGMKCVGVGQQDILKKADLIVPGLDHVQLSDLHKLFDSG
ncbi:MAG: beta-phosphoglucomutase [Bacteroidetes bacterium]|jgi:beta-phosphoglucomutase|nr:beta-phosphoglucomutase [Bacteroidota bacterium]